MRICVYTVITGGYDSLIEINYKNDNFDYLCFTNDKSLKSDTWEIIFVDEPLDDQLLSRKIKILCCQYLSDYDASLYIDGKVTVRKDIFPFIQSYLKPDIDLVGFKHPYRDCIYEEIYTCIKYEKEKLSVGLQVYKKYKQEGMPSHYGLSDNAIIIRRHNEAVKQLMERWFHMVETYTRRDQLSFFYCLWKTPVSVLFLEDNIADNDYFSIQPYHTPKHRPQKKFALFDFNPEGQNDVSLLREVSYLSGLPKIVLEISIPVSCEAFRIRIDELGNSLLAYSTDSDLSIEPIYGIPLVDEFLFFNNFSLEVKGCLEKGRVVHIELEIKEFSRYDLALYFMHYNSQRLNLISCQSELKILKNSKSYKIGRAVTWLPRKIRDLLRRCCE